MKMTPTGLHFLWRVLSLGLQLCVKVEACLLGQNFKIRKQVSFKEGLGAFWSVASAVGPGEGGSHEALKNNFSFVQPVSHGHKPWWLSKLPMYILKVGVPDRGSNTLFLKGKLSCEFPPSCGCGTGVGVDGKLISLSYIFQCGFFACLYNMQESLNQFLDFFQKKVFFRWLYIWCVHGMRGVQDLLLSPS